MLCVGSAEAQLKTVKNVANVVSTATGYFKDFDITGTWVYKGVDVQFKSHNLLKKAGGKLAASSVEKNLDRELKKLGFKEGVTVFVFEENGKFRQTTGGTTLHGTYEFSGKDETITLKYMNHIPLTTYLSGSKTSLSLLFETNNFLSFVSFLGNHSGISVLNAVTNILNSFDGMMVGIKLDKQK